VLRVSNDRRLRDALQKDDADIARLLKRVIGTEAHKKEVLRLKGTSAQQCVDLIQDVWAPYFSIAAIADRSRRYWTRAH
jgi:hypothetical protein